MTRDRAIDQEKTATLLEYAQKLCQERLLAYRSAAHDAEEHANIELSVLAGGYAYRQVAELVQNAADAVSEGGEDTGKIEINVNDAGLWAANTGAPVDQAGIKALLNTNVSAKRADQIGRFGIGFKSLLKLGGRISVLSRTISLHFDPDKCRRKVRHELGLSAEAPAPGLRLADATSWASGLELVDGAAAYSWADTIIFAEMITEGAREGVLEEMRRFPAEFLLFLPRDVELALKGPGLDRRLVRQTNADGMVSVEDLAGDKRPTQSWRLFQRNVEITDRAALNDATSVHGRGTVPLIWAAPVGATREIAGRFYAFFPTTTETRTLGILNAPWKLNSDRTAVIPGAWNAALMAAAAELIVDHMPHLAHEGDPGIVLDAFPRELQHLGEPAAPLVQNLWTRLMSAPVLPNCNGDLTDARTLNRAPIDAPDVVSAWSALAASDVRRTYIHPTCTATNSRTGRLRQLTEKLSQEEHGQAAALSARAPVEWLDLIASSDPTSAVEVLKVADMYATTATGFAWDQIRDRLRIILGEDGTINTAPSVTLAEPDNASLRRIHPALSSDTEIRRILKSRFGIDENIASDWNRLVGASVRTGEETGNWDSVWKLIRNIPVAAIRPAIRQHQILVRTGAGWSKPKRCFRRGDTVQDGDLTALGEREQILVLNHLVDEAYHGEDAYILEILGVGKTPSWDWTIIPYVDSHADPANEWLRKWKAHWHRKYLEALEFRPDSNLLKPTPFQMPAGWEILTVLNGEPLRRATLSLCEALEVNDAGLKPVIFYHTTRPQAWPSKPFPHPLWHLLMERGVLAGPYGEISFQALLVQGGDERLKMIPSLTGRGSLMQRLQTSAAGFSSALDESSAWKNWFALAEKEHAEVQDLVPFYELAAKSGFAPPSVCSLCGPIDLTQILLAHSLRDVQSATAAGLYAVSMSRDAETLWLQHGARQLSAEAKLEWSPSNDEAEGILLLELEPTLRPALEENAAMDAGIIFARLLGQSLRDTWNDLDWAVDDGRLILHEERFLQLGWKDRLRLLFEGAKACGWLIPEASLDLLENTSVDARRRNVAKMPDLASRLLAAVADPGVILALFENDVQRALQEDPVRAASIAITLMGPALLAEPSIREALEREGLSPPSRWGGEAATEFVTSLGFPAEFAISPNRRRDPELVVNGPIPLKPLHDYQEAVVKSVNRLLLEPDNQRRRAVISLPTGAGKTRVAAQTAVLQVLVPDSSPKRLVIWIAQTDELCEQAVQCFRELWANLGNRDEKLRVIRFWGGQANPLPPQPDEPTVVVASIQTFTARLSGSPLAWLNRPGVVVIDECHHALTPSYTALLQWLNRNQSEEPPVIGLSATPFRGRNLDETAQLARRFDGRLYPKHQGDLFELLQRQGVLATFEYTRLDMEKNFSLTIEEQHHLRTFNKLPDSALERLGNDGERNDLILSTISEAPERSALLFATSVAHARRLAARLNLLGISSAVVSGETDRSSRRWFIKAFQEGEVRVLCNHSALTTGFDAPATDLIVIARPVFSPSLYMQMVGRGLRGPKNGGKPKCRILTVQDNLDRYSGELAHHYFEKHYL